MTSGGLGRSITGGGENDRPAAPVVLVVDLDRGVVLAPDDVAEDGAVAVDRSALSVVPLLPGLEG